MSTFAYGLLTTFIVQNNLLLVASIMNDRITFDKAPDFPGISRHVVELEVQYVFTTCNGSQAACYKIVFSVDIICI